MTPNQYPDLFSTITLGVATSPGVVTLAGHDRDPKWDVAEAKGQTGASSTLTGASIGQFQATFFLASAADQIAWPLFQRVLESTFTGATPKALPVYHPDLAANHFTEVCAMSIGGVVRDERGGATVLVKFIEYKPPTPKASKTASGGSAGAGGTGGGSGAKEHDDYDPNAARKDELDALLAEAREA